MHTLASLAQSGRTLVSKRARKAIVPEGAAGGPWRSSLGAWYATQSPFFYRSVRDAKSLATLRAVSGANELRRLGPCQFRSSLPHVGPLAFSLSLRARCGGGQILGNGRS